MPDSILMNLKILLPFRVFATESGVVRILADTSVGSMGILPRRMDFVAVLTPGILVYETSAGGEAYVAVDDGVLIKTGFEVHVSVRNAIAGSDLRELQQTVEREFRVLDEHEQNVRSVLSKMQSAFISQIATFSHE